MSLRWLWQTALSLKAVFNDSALFSGHSIGKSVLLHYPKCESYKTSLLKFLMAHSPSIAQTRIIRKEILSPALTDKGSAPEQYYKLNTDPVDNSTICKPVERCKEKRHLYNTAKIFDKMAKARIAREAYAIQWVRSYRDKFSNMLAKLYSILIGHWDFIAAGQQRFEFSWTNIIPTLLAAYSRMA